MQKKARKKPLKAVEHQVREQCQQACGNPRCREWSSATHELHHIDEDRANSVAENLILLCASCHSKQQAGVFSSADIGTWKRMAEYAALPPPRGFGHEGPREVLGIYVRSNTGVAAHTVNIENLNVAPPKHANSSVGTSLPGTIGADAAMRTYATYLVKRYIEWRKKGISMGFDKRNFKAGSAHSILGKEFGSPSSVLQIDQTQFHSWSKITQKKINETIWGKMNPHRNFHSWDEHLDKRRGKD